MGFTAVHKAAIFAGSKKRKEQIRPTACDAIDTWVQALLQPKAALCVPAAPECHSYIEGQVRSKPITTEGL